MHDKRSLIESRLARVLNERLRSAAHRRLGAVDVAVWHAPDEPVPPAEALRATYAPARIGDAWGPPWGTTWFHLTGTAPADGVERRLELVVDLGWNAETPGFQAEGLVYRPDGSVIKGLHPRNGWVPVEGSSVDVYVEGASNPSLNHALPTALGDKATAGAEPLYRLTRADLCVAEVEVRELIADLEVLGDLARSLPDAAERCWAILYAVERALDRIDLEDIAGTAAAARAELVDVLASPASPSAHRVSAVGHAHIDSAWLWPTRETVRKVARTTANVVHLLDEFPDLVYAMSSAQQYAWVEQRRPEVFAEVARQVRAGRFVPVGGMWVESDTNMVGGEAMVRQFLHGKQYFLDRFGVECREVWLPDSFGYSAGLPQIMKLAGCDSFLTQKISWSQLNPFPHHTFEWEGIDGTRIFTHFPPVDTYNSELTGAELAHAASNFRDKGVASRSLVPFGFGNGGGGPTREMVARARRTGDLEGSPRVTMESPADFFAAAKAEYESPPVWVGELYLETHRGTYTSQAKTKHGNRRSEHLLREAELWATTAAVRGVEDYPYDDLDRIWQVVLLQQFHDILPGSSIAWVHREARANYAVVADDLEQLIAHSAARLVGEGDTELELNASPFGRDGVAALGIGPRARSADPVSVERDGDAVVLDNALLRVRIDERGIVTSVRDLRADREVLPPGGVANLLQAHPDFPRNYDAWDVDAYYRNVTDDITAVDSIGVDTDPYGAAQVSVARSFGSTALRQVMTLAPGSAQLDCVLDIDWHERETILKAAFDLDVHCDRAAYETQFGHVVRPTHENTSWDAARYEVCAHRYVRLAEPGYGVAVVNDTTYGHDVTRRARSGGGTSSTVRLSLLRAPRYPDPETDQGRHRIGYALRPGAAPIDAVEAGYAINLPTRVVRGQLAGEPLVSVSDGALVEAVKLAHDRSGDVIVRLYEPVGARADVTLRASFDVETAHETDLLERPGDAEAIVGGLAAGPDGPEVRLSLRPFQIVTVRLRPKP
jgi:alpha-mannosidase